MLVWPREPRSDLAAPQGGGTDLTVFVPDADPLTTTDATDSDSDDDGLLDGEEDVNANGQVDPGETSPTNSGSDGDGASDGYEVASGTDALDPEEFPPVLVPALGPLGVFLLVATMLGVARRHRAPAEACQQEPDSSHGERGESGDSGR